MPWHEGDVVHKLRRMCGWTVEELARRASINTSVIYRLEDGRTRDPKRPTIEKLSAAFGFDVRDFRHLVPPGNVELKVDVGTEAQRGKHAGEVNVPTRRRRQAG